MGLGEDQDPQGQSRAAEGPVGPDGLPVGSQQPDQPPQVGGHMPVGYLFGLLEPAIFHDKVVNMGGAEAIFCKEVPNDQVRAAIIYNPHLNMWAVDEFMNRDMATGLLTGSDLGDVYIVALYCHEDLPAVPRKFRQLMARAKQENREVLVLSDLNSHSQSLWGGKDTNARGRKWEEFLERQGQLSVLNKGDKFTFVTNKGQSIIDVTLATAKVVSATAFWEVSDYVAASDHLAISFVLHIGGGWTIPRKGWDIKDMSEEAWKSFEEDMELDSQPIPTSSLWWNMSDMNREANLFMSDITKALDSHAKQLHTKINIRPLSWWDKKCSELHHKMKSKDCAVSKL